MKKIKYLILICGFFILISCYKKRPTDTPSDNKSHPQVDIPWPALADSPWPISRGNVQNTGRSKYPGPSEGVIEWIFTEDMMGRIFGSPVIGEDGTIYISTDRHLYAVNPDGTLKWEFNRGEMTQSSIMIARGDIIYFSTGSQNIDPNYLGYLYALDSDGNVLWEYRSNDMMFSFTSTLGIDGTIYFTDLGGHLNAVNPDGSLKWKTRGKGEFRSGYSSSVAISPNGTALYAFGKDSTIYAINAQTGDIVWQLPTGINIRSSPLVDNDGNIYFFGKEEKIPYIYSATKDGEIRFKFTHEELYTLSYDAGLHMDKDGYIYFCSGHEFYSLDYEGSLRRRIPFPSGEYPSSPILGDKNANVYLGLFAAYLLSFDQSGNKRFESIVPGKIFMGALSNNRRLYIGVETKLYCIGNVK